MRSPTISRPCSENRLADRLRRLAFAALPSAGADDKPAPLGFGFQVYTDGLFGVTVVKATVAAVVPDSQAMKAAGKYLERKPLLMTKLFLVRQMELIFSEQD